MFLLDLPPEMKCLEELKKLNLSRNIVDYFPEVLLTMKNLKELNLRGNRLSFIIRDLTPMTSLGSLDLRGNKGLSNLPISLPKNCKLNIDNHVEVILEDSVDVKEETDEETFWVESPKLVPSTRSRSRLSTKTSTSM